MTRSRISRWLVPLGLVLLAAEPPAARACSQCLCGEPVPPSMFGTLAPTRLRFGLENRTLSKSNALAEEPGRESQHEQRLSAFALARPKDRLVLQARVPYSFKRLTESPDGAPSTTETSDGFGDAELIARWRFTDLALGEGRPGGVALVAGGTAPTGRNHLTDSSGERLEQHLQPGSGAWSGTLGLEANTPTGGLELSAGVIGRVNGTNDRGEHYGSALLYNAGMTTRRYGAWQFVLAGNGRSARQDIVDESGALDPESGGTVVYAAPAVRFFGASGLVLDAATQLPVLSELEGAQEEHTTFRLTLSIAP